MTLSVEQKVKLAAEMLVDAPPGEFHEVLNDIRTLISNDAKLQLGLKSTLAQYNSDQFITAKLPGSDTEVLMSKWSQLDDNDAFWCPRTQQRLKFDHIRQQITAAEKLTEIPTEFHKLEQVRQVVDKAVLSYVGDHYQQGVSSVVPVKNQDKLVICIASNKFNPSNFWNGRWRSEWTVSTNGKATVTGWSRVHVHYYEDGNVQLATDRQFEFDLSTDVHSDGGAAALMAKIMELEAEYQVALNESYAQLSDTTFKSLRRALPVTKSKLDWSKISSYKVTHNMGK